MNNEQGNSFSQQRKYLGVFCFFSFQEIKNLDWRYSVGLYNFNKIPLACSRGGCFFLLCVGLPEPLIFQRHLKRKHGIPSQCVAFSGCRQRRFLKKLAQKVRKKRLCLIMKVKQKLAVPDNLWRKMLPYAWSEEELKFGKVVVDDGRSAAWQLSCRPAALFSPVCLPWSARPTEMKDKDSHLFPIAGVDNCPIQEPWNIELKATLKEMKEIVWNSLSQIYIPRCPILLSYPFPHLFGMSQIPCEFIPEERH